MPIITSGMDYSKGGGGTWKVRPSLGLNAPLTTAELKESLKTLPVGSAYSGDIWRQAREYEEMQEGKKTALDDLGNVYQQGITSYSEAANSATQEAIGNIEKRYTDQEQMLIQNAQRQGVGMTQLQNPNSPLSKLRAQKTAEINAEKSKTVRDIANMTNMLNLEYGKTKYAQTTGQKAEDFALKNQRMQTGIAADEEQRTQERAQARQDEMLDKVTQMQGGGAGGLAPVEGRQETGAMFTDEEGQPILDSRQTQEMTTQWEKGVEDVNASVEKTAASYGYGDAQKKNLTIKRMNDLAKKLKSQYDLPQSVEEIAQKMQEVGYQKERGREVTNSLGKLARGSELTEDERNSLIDTVGPEAVLKAEQAGSDEERTQAIFDIQKQQGLLNIDIAQNTLDTMETEFGWKKEEIQKMKAKQLNEENAMSVLAETYSGLYSDGNDPMDKLKGISDALVIIKGMGLSQATDYFERVKEGKVVESTRKKQEALALEQKTKAEEATAFFRAQMVEAGLGTSANIEKFPPEVIADVWLKTIGSEMQTTKGSKLEAEMIQAVKDTQELARLESEIGAWQQKLDAVADSMKVEGISASEATGLKTEYSSYTKNLNSAIDKKLTYVNGLKIPNISSAAQKQNGATSSPAQPAPQAPMPIPLTEPKTLEETINTYKNMYPQKSKESIWDMASNAWEAWKKSEAEAVANREAEKSKKALKEFYKGGK